MSDREPSPRESSTNQSAELDKLWNDWLDSFERQANAALGTLTGSDGFSRFLATLTESSFVWSKATRSTAKATLRAANLPSREDLLSVTERLARVEDRLVDLQLTLERLAEGQGAASLSSGSDSSGRARPPRTKKAPRQADSEGQPAASDDDRVETAEPEQTKTKQKKSTKKPAAAKKTKKKASSRASRKKTARTKPAKSKTRAKTEKKKKTTTAPRAKKKTSSRSRRGGGREA